MNSESLIARCGERLDENLDFVRLDVPRVLTRPLVFDSYILECSLRLRELAAPDTIGMVPEVARITDIRRRRAVSGLINEYHARAA